MRRLAILFWAAALSLLVVSVAFAVADREVARGPDDSLVIGFLFLFEIFAFTSVGAVVAARRPGNPIGWLLAGYGLVGAAAVAADGYANHALRGDPGSLPGGTGVAWAAGFVIDAPGLVFGFFVFLLLLFPHGRLPSRRWRRALALLVPVLVALQALTTLKPGELDGFPAVENPLGVAAVESVEFLEAPLFLILLGFVVASAFSLVRRFRAAHGEERQQLKWVVAAGAFLAAAIASAPLWWSGVIPDAVSEVGWPVLFAISLASIPLACGVAILRYRLYDVDVVINRTLVYGLLTALLAGSYFGFVLLFQLALNPLTEENELTIAASTLAVAALFRPARRRIQAIVDRRFYRRKYDAAQTLEAFAARLRSEIDLDALRGELTGVVRETMQPAHVSLWLRKGTP